MKSIDKSVNKQSDSLQASKLPYSLCLTGFIWLQLSNVYTYSSMSFDIYT